MGNDDDLSLSSSASTISSTVTKFYGFGGTVVVRVFDRVSGFERPNVVDLISDNENNDNRNIHDIDNDNDTHQSVISISSSISSSSIQIVEGPSPAIPLVSPDITPIYDNLSSWTTGTHFDKFPSTMAKSKKKTQLTDEEAYQAIESSGAQLPSRRRNKPTQFCSFTGDNNNDNNDNNKSKVKKKKKKKSSTSVPKSSNLAAIPKANTATPIASKKRQISKSKSPMINDDSDDCLSVAAASSSSLPFLPRELPQESSNLLPFLPQILPQEPLPSSTSKEKKKKKKKKKDAVSPFYHSFILFILISYSYFLLFFPFFTFKYIFLRLHQLMR